MTFRGTVLALVVFGLTAAPPQQKAAFDPVGTWNVSTIDSDGTAMKVAMAIQGKPGAYTGTATTPNGELPLTHLATTPGGMIVIFALPQSSVVVMLSSDGPGKLVGQWGEIEQVFPVTAERGKGPGSPPAR
jgi:hypothetical protein